MTSPFLSWILAAAERRNDDLSFFDRYPGMWDMLLLFLALGLVAVMIWFARSASRTTTGFVIHVDEDDITFTGQFPANMQPTVIEFLRNDVALPDCYKIRGHWEDRLLIVAVQGEHARSMEQRIRNFLKLNLKPPR